MYFSVANGQIAADYLSLQHSLGTDEVVEDVFGHVGVHSRQRVVQQVNISVAVQSSGQAHPLSLTTGEVDALSDDGDTSAESVLASMRPLV